MMWTSRLDLWCSLSGDLPSVSGSTMTCLAAGAVSCSNKTSSGHGEWRWIHCSGVALENGGRREEQGGDSSHQ